MTAPASRETVLLVDGENIDATLGGSLLGRRPAPEERPRWDRVREYARAVWDQPVRALFFLNASGQIPMAFVQALTALDYRPVLLSGPTDVRWSTSRSCGPSRRSRSVATATWCSPRTTATSRLRLRRCSTASTRGASAWSASASSSRPRSPTCRPTASPSSTWRTTSAPSPSRCRGSASSRSSASILGPCSAERSASGVAAASATRSPTDGSCAPPADTRPPARPPGRARRPLGSKAMDYRALGRTGVEVSPLCLGAMMFGDWGNRDHDDSVRIIHRALDAGINFIDTADVYSRGESEEIVGKALAGGRRDDVVLATKVHGR